MKKHFLPALALLGLILFSPIVHAALSDANRGDYMLLPRAPALASGGTTVALLTPNQIKADVYVNCAAQKIARPKPAGGSCTAPVTLFCEYHGENCTYTTHGSTPDSRGQQYVRTISHIQCDTVDGACPSATVCAATGLSERTRLALRIQSIDRAAAKEGAKVQ